MQGKYQQKAVFPYKPGVEAVGKVVEVGPGVRGLSPGDHALAFSVHGGAFAQEVTVTEDACYKMNYHEKLSLAEGCALFSSYATAYLSIATRAKIKSSDTVLVTAAAGALGLATVDLAANVFGCKVIGACGGADKCALVRQYGAVAAIDYNSENLRDRVKELTRGKGVDIIVDMVGGKVFEDCLKNIAFEGQILVLGFAGGDIPKVSTNLLLLKNCTMQGVFFGNYMLYKRAVLDESILAILKLWEEGKVKPHIGKIFQLSQINSAFDFLMKRGSTGKVLLDCENC